MQTPEGDKKPQDKNSRRGREYNPSRRERWKRIYIIPAAKKSPKELPATEEGEPINPPIYRSKLTWVIYDVNKEKDYP